MSQTDSNIGELLAFIEAMAALGYAVELTKGGNFRGAKNLDESLKELKDERKSSLETLDRLTDELKDVLKKEKEC